MRVAPEYAPPGQKTQALNYPIGGVTFVQATGYRPAMQDMQISLIFR
jgi:hypothetical protein